MGIRITKVLGYGLTDVKYDKENWKLVDERINPDSFLLDAYEYKDKTGNWPPTTADYLEWIKTNTADSHGWSLDSYLSTDRVDITDHKYDLDSCLHYQPEYGEDNVMVIRPVSCPDWERYDNIIDYVESTFLHSEDEEPCINKVQKIEHGIFPWVGTYMDRRSGARLNNYAMDWIRAKSGGYYSDRPWDMDRLAQLVGFRDSAEAEANITPTIPAPIIDLCKFANLFVDDSVFLEMTPVLYTYWA